MVVGKKRDQLTAKGILNKISEYDIYRFYIGEDFNIGRVMHSPMPGRRDNHPSFLVGARSGFLYHVDFADSKFRGNCFQFVMQQQMLPSYNDALKKIDKDFNLGISLIPSLEYKTPVFNQPTLKDTKPKFIQVQYTSKMTLEEKRYWEQFYISSREELEGNDIYAVRKYLIDRQVQPMRLGELTFGYKYGSLWKIYRPEACKDRKWKTNIPIDGIENLEKALLDDETNIIVTKARKDRVILQKFRGGVASVQNESLVALNTKSVELLQNCGEEVYINYDADEPGKKASWSVTAEFGFKHLNVPDSYLQESIKDFADLIKVYGPDTVHKYLQSKKIVS